MSDSSRTFLTGRNFKCDLKLFGFRNYRYCDHLISVNFWTNVLKFQLLLPKYKHFKGFQF